MKKIFMSPQEIEALLVSFKDAGYDRIHLSGGTSKDGTHYGGTIVYKYDKSSKKIAFVGLPYDSVFYKREQNKDKQPGHTKKEGETPEETAWRELFEETGLKANPDKMIKVHYNERPDNRPEYVGKMHRQYFYLVNMDDCTGELMSFEGANPSDGETMAPVLFVSSEFYKILFGGHLSALIKATDQLRAIKIEYYYAL